MVRRRAKGLAVSLTCAGPAARVPSAAIPSKRIIPGHKEPRSDAFVLFMFPDRLDGGTGSAVTHSSEAEPLALPVSLARSCACRLSLRATTDFSTRVAPRRSVWKEVMLS